MEGEKEDILSPPFQVFGAESRHTQESLLWERDVVLPA